MNETIALAIKDLRILVRDKAGFFFTFLFPILIAVFFGTLYGGFRRGPSGMKVLVVDEDRSDESRRFVATLDASAELRVEQVTREEAVARVRRGQSVAYIVLTEGFGKAREQVFWRGSPKIELGVDPARKAEAGMLKGILMKHAADGFQDLFGDTTAMRDHIRKALAEIGRADDVPAERRGALSRFFGEMDRFLAEEKRFEDRNTSGSEEQFRGFQPVDIEEVGVSVKKKGPNNAFAVSFPQGILWGILSCAAGFGISLVVERSRGTLSRLRTAPISRMKILAGKGLACFVITFAMSCALFTLGVIAFNVRANSYPLLVMAVISACLAFVGIMMFLSVLGKTEAAANGIAWPILMVMAFTGGGAMPLAFMPPWLQTVSHFSPVKWALLAMEGAIWRGFTLHEMFAPCGILLAIAFIFFTIGVRTFRWTEG